MTIIDPRLLSGAAIASTAAAVFPGSAPSPEQEEKAQSVIVGDCLAVLRAMASGSIDAAVTSPPYNIGVAYRSYDDRMPRDIYLAWMDESAKQIARVLAEDGALFLNLSSTGTDPWIAADVAGRFRQHLTLQNRITWVKSISVDGETRGHFKPINSCRFLNRTNEEIFHFTKRGDAVIDRLAIGVPYQDKSNVSRWKQGRDRRCGGNSWHIPYETIRSKASRHNHPAAFPVGVPLRCLGMHGRKGLVLDPFLGSGTTLVAARMAGWNGIGIEIDEVYANTARRRIAEVSRGREPCPGRCGKAWSMAAGRLSLPTSWTEAFRRLGRDT